MRARRGGRRYGRRRARRRGGRQALPRGFDADQLDGRVVDEGDEAADRVRAAADTGDDAVGKPPRGREDLLAGLVADHPLEVADERRVRGRADRGADDVVGVGDVRDPVADRGADRLLQGPGTGLDGLDLRSEEPHPLHVRALAAHVLGAHVDDTVEAEEGAGRRRRDPVLAGPGLGDYPALAHPLRQQRLADGVVDLVGAGVSEVLAFQVDGPPNPFGESRGEVERRRPADEVAQEAVELLAEAGIGARLLPGRGRARRGRRSGPRERSGPRRGRSVTGRRSLPCRPWATARRTCFIARRRSRSARWISPARFAAAMNEVIRSWSLTPGDCSTPLQTSTPRDSRRRWRRRRCRS